MSYVSSLYHIVIVTQRREKTIIEEKAKDLAGRFIKNFAKFTGNEAGKKLVAAGPKL